jgi:hypothetical protein
MSAVERAQRFDLHMHSAHSPDSGVRVEDMVREARARGLAGIAITDHNQVEGSLKSRALAGNGFIAVRATEVSTSIGHIIALGVAERIPRDLAPAEAIERIHALGGIASIAHPLRIWSGVGEQEARRIPADLVETVNGRTISKHNLVAAAIARERGLSATAGSDAHELRNIGRAYVVLEERVETEEALLEALRRGRARAEGISRKPAEWIPYGVKCIVQWMSRGFKRM